MRTTQKLLMLAGAACLVAGLAACGGDDDTPTPAPTAAVPSSASASVDGYISYLKQLVASSADTLQPVDISAVVPPTSDTTEPTPIM